MPSIDFTRAAAFVAAVPRGRWTTYKDVAVAAGSPNGAQAVGQWLRRNGDQITGVYRVLTIDGFVAEGFVPASHGPTRPNRRPSSTSRRRQPQHQHCQAGAKECQVPSCSRERLSRSH